MKTVSFFIARAKLDADLFLQSFSGDKEIVIAALLAAEDHRARYHRGIDWISVGRSFLSSVRTGRIAGMSTIEQQYVRTVIRRSGNVFACKIVELVIVALSSQHLAKQQIWLGYLWRAYFGYLMNGYADVRRSYILDDRALDPITAAKIVAQLKYPKPKRPTVSWHSRHVQRVAYVLRRMEPDAAVPKTGGQAAGSFSM